MKHADNRKRTVEHIEGSVIASLMAGAAPHVFAICSPPVARWFSTPRFRRVAAALDRLLAEQAPTGAADVLAALPADDSAAGQIEPGELIDLELGARTGDGAAEAAKALRNAKTARDLYATTIELQKRLESSEIGKDAAPEIERHLAALRSLDLGAGRDLNLGEATRLAVEAGRQAAARQGQPATWGLPELDDLIPLEPGRLYILAAAPKAGKTSLALQAAIASADAAHPSGGKVALASLEMTAPEVARVIAGAAADVPHHKIRTGRMDADEEARVLALADAWAGQDVFWIRDTTSGTSAETCESYLAWLQFRQQASGGKIALAVLDYLGLLSPSNQRDTEYAAISKNTRALKLAAVRMQIPLVVLCQMNRDGRKQTHSRDGEAQGQVEPTLGALRGSGSIEQDADAVLFLHCPNPPEKGDSGPRIVRATLAASRFCQPGRIDLMFWGEQQRFTTAPEEAQPQTSTPEIAPERRAALGEHAADMLFGDA